jgi:hypothetical protein
MVYEPATADAIASDVWAVAVAGVCGRCETALSSMRVCSGTGYPYRIGRAVASMPAQTKAADGAKA